MSSAGLTFSAKADGTSQNEGSYGPRDMATDCNPPSQVTNENVTGGSNESDNTHDTGRMSGGSYHPSGSDSSLPPPPKSAASVSGQTGAYGDLTGQVSDVPSRPPVHRRVVSDSVRGVGNDDQMQRGRTPRTAGGAGCSADNIAMSDMDMAAANPSGDPSPRGAAAAQLFSWMEDGLAASGPSAGGMGSTQGIGGGVAGRQQGSDRGMSPASAGVSEPAIGASRSSPPDDVQMKGAIVEMGGQGDGNSNVNALLGWRALSSSGLAQAGDDGVALDVFGGGDRAAAVAAAMAAAAGISTAGAGNGSNGVGAGNGGSSPGWASHGRSFSVDDVFMNRGDGATTRSGGDAPGFAGGGVPGSQSHGGRSPLSPSALPPLSPRPYNTHSPRPSLSPRPQPSLSPGPNSCSTGSQAPLSPPSGSGMGAGVGGAGTTSGRASLSGLGAGSGGSAGGYGSSLSSMRRSRRDADGLSIKDELDDMDDEDAVRRVLATKKPTADLETIDAKKAKR